MHQCLPCDPFLLLEQHGERLNSHCCDSRCWESYLSMLRRGLSCPERLNTFLCNSWLTFLFFSPSYIPINVIPFGCTNAKPLFSMNGYYRDQKCIQIIYSCSRAVTATTATAAVKAGISRNQDTTQSLSAAPQRVSKVSEDTWSKVSAQRRATRSEAGLLCCKVALTVRKMDVNCSIFGVDHRIGGSWIRSINGRLIFASSFMESNTQNAKWEESLQKDPDRQTLLRMESNFLYYYCGNDD